MSLKIQVISSLFSFLYGIIFSLLLNLNYNILFSGSRLLRSISNLLFLSDFAMLYFLIMKKINEGILHPYFYLFLILGFLLTFKKGVPLRKFLKELPKSVKKKKETTNRLK